MLQVRAGAEPANQEDEVYVMTLLCAADDVAANKFARFAHGSLEHSAHLLGGDGEVSRELTGTVHVVAREPDVRGFGVGEGLLCQDELVSEGVAFDGEEGADRGIAEDGGKVIAKGGVDYRGTVEIACGEEEG